MFLARKLGIQNVAGMCVPSCPVYLINLVFAIDLVYRLYLIYLFLIYSMESI